MHFLLIPYALLSAIFVLHFLTCRQKGSRAGLAVISYATGTLLFVAMLLRPVGGDSWGYYQRFIKLRNLGLRDAFQDRASDPLFTLLSWLAGQFGTSELLLFGATLVVFFGIFVLALRRLLAPAAAAVVFVCYAAFPYFVAYAANALRQGLAMACLLMALVQYSRGRRDGWLWLLVAPLWHSGAWLAVIVIAAHQSLILVTRRERLRWVVVLGTLGVAILLSATGVNKEVLGRLPVEIPVEIPVEKLIYFTDPSQYGYRAGFRADFLLFSLVPLASAWALRRRAPTFSYRGPGWWLSIYLSLNILYHLFAFVPFADRFASFSWFLMPLVIFLQVRETRSRPLQIAFVSVVALVNLVMLQFYTGKFIAAPGWLF
jgi:hypothetical protein